MMTANEAHTASRANTSVGVVDDIMGNIIEPAINKAINKGLYSTKVRLGGSQSDNKSRLTPYSLTPDIIRTILNTLTGLGYQINAQQNDSFSFTELDVRISWDIL